MALSLIANKMSYDDDTYLMDSLVYRLLLAIEYRKYSNSDGAVIVNNQCIENIAIKLI